MDIDPGVNALFTNLYLNGDKIGSACNGNNGTNATVTNLANKSGSVGVSGNASYTGPFISTLYAVDTSAMYGSQPQAASAQNSTWSLPVTISNGGYAGGNGSRQSATYTGIFGTSYGPGKIGGGQSSPALAQSGVSNSWLSTPTSYIGGGAIITYY